MSGHDPTGTCPAGSVIRSPGPVHATNPRLRDIAARLAAAPADLGSPTACDIDYRPLAPLLSEPAEPHVDLQANQLQDLEREVLDVTAALLHAPPGWSGHLTSGDAEGVLCGLWLGRTKLPNAVAYYSSAAHSRVPVACHLLGLPAVEVAATATGQMDYTDLTRTAARRRSRPAIVVATIGTRMTESVDDVTEVHNALDVAGVRHRHVHSDAALAGVPLATTVDRPAIDLGDGADSISVSGHTFFGTPLECGIVLTRRRPEQRCAGMPRLGTRYSAVRDPAIASPPPCCGTPSLPSALARYTDRACRASEVAAHAVQRLHRIGWPAWRNPLSFTVMLRRLPADVATSLRLPTHDDWSHLICMPGVETSHIDHLVGTLAAYVKNS